MTTVPSYVAKGTYAHGISSVAPGIPAGMQAGDLMILVIETQATTNPSLPSGWDPIPVGANNADNPTGTTNDWRVSIAYRFWQSGDAAPTVADTGDHTSAIIIGIRGAHPVTPFGSDAAPGDRTGSIGTSTQMQFSQLVTQAGETNVLCVFVGVWAADNAGPIISSFANTSPYTNVSTRQDGGHTDGEGGGVFIVTADRAAASLNANPSLTVNQLFATSAGGMGFYLLPEPDTTDITISGSLAAITGTASVNLTNEVSSSGALAAFAGAATVDLINEIEASGSLAPFAGAAEVENTVPDTSIDIDIVGSLPPMSGAAEVELPVHVDVAGSLAPMTIEAEVELTIEVTVSGALAAVVGSSSGPVVEVENCYTVDGDQRELILARLHEVLQGLGATTVLRNDKDIPETGLPAICMYDGDETVMEETFGRGRPAYGPNIVTLLPEIYVTDFGDTPEEAGEKLSAWETVLRNAILGDATLQSLVHNLSIRYIGNETGVAVGRQAYGQMKVEMAFDYALTLDAPCAGNTPYTSDDAYSYRENILDALLAIANDTEGVRSAVRNDLSVPEDPESLPRIIVYDGSEASDSDMWGRGRPPDAPNLIRMEPEIYIVLRPGTSEIGPYLNRIRCMFLRGVLTNPSLAALAVDGDIRYEGCQTALAAGRTLTGEMGVMLSITRIG